MDTKLYNIYYIYMVPNPKEGERCGVLVKRTGTVNEQMNPSKSHKNIPICSCCFCPSSITQRGFQWIDFSAVPLVCWICFHSLILTLPQTMKILWVPWIIDRIYFFFLLMQTPAGANGASFWNNWIAASNSFQSVQQLGLKKKRYAYHRVINPLTAVLWLAVTLRLCFIISI